MTEQLEEGARLRLQLATQIGPAMLAATDAVLHCLKRGGKILLCGNGGSAADAQHLAAEFVGRFARERRGYPAIALTTDTSALTAIGNDYGFHRVFERQVEAIGNKGDVMIAISTSGNSRNVVAAARTAKRLGIKVIGLLGRAGSALAKTVDIPFLVESDSSARIQECHITIGHILCDLVDEDLARLGCHRGGE